MLATQFAPTEPAPRKKAGYPPACVDGGVAAPVGGVAETSPLQRDSGANMRWFITAVAASSPPAAQAGVLELAAGFVAAAPSAWRLERKIF